MTELWNELYRRGWVVVEEPPARVESSLAVSFMLAGAAWLAAPLVMVFIGLTLSDLWRSPSALVGVGTLCGLGAVMGLRAVPEHGFLGQFLVPFSLAGLFMLAAGVFGLNGGGGRYWGSGNFTALWTTLLVAGGLLALATPHSVHRFLTAGAALLGLAALLEQHQLLAWLPPLIVATLVLLEFWLPGGRRLTARPGVTAGQVALALTALVSCWFGSSLALQMGDFDRYRPPGWGPDLATLAVFVALVLLLQRRHGLPFDGRVGLSLLLPLTLLGLLLVPASGVLIGLILLMLGFAGGNRALVLLALVGLPVYLSRYYYQMDTTLLVKSAVLAASGACLLVLRWALSRWTGARS